MIEVDTTIFPHNVVEVVAIPFSNLDPDVKCFKRPLRNTDPQQSIGIHAQMWDPDPESYEFLGSSNIHPQQPTLQVYTYGAQAFVKDGDEERGLAVHAALAHRLRTVLYTYEPLQVALRQLVVPYQDGQVEGLKRWGIRTARYFSGEINSVNLYLSTLEFWVQTEIRGA